MRDFIDVGPIVTVRDREGRSSVETVAVGHHVVTNDERGIGGFVLDEVVAYESAKTGLGDLRDALEHGRTPATHARDPAKTARPGAGHRALVVVVTKHASVIR